MLAHDRAPDARLLARELAQLLGAGEHQVQRILVGPEEVFATGRGHLQQARGRALGPAPVEIEEKDAAVEIRAVIIETQGDRDARDAQAFVDRWRPRVDARTDAAPGSIRQPVRAGDRG